MLHINLKYDYSHSPRMAGLQILIDFSVIMGLSIFLSTPLLVSKTKTNYSLPLNAVAVGILIFLVGDVFSNASSSLYNGSLYGYGTDPLLDLIFAVSLVAGFLVLLAVGDRSQDAISPARLSLLIAVGIGFQNLTEGLVFGSLGSIIGFTGATLVVLLGFTLQNATEGFPIASPFMGKSDGTALRLILPLFLIGGVPTIIGTIAGYYYNSTVLDMVFDGLAIGGILYVVLPILRNIFRHPNTATTMYLAVFMGFMLGFLVNLL